MLQIKDKWHAYNGITLSENVCGSTGLRNPLHIHGEVVKKEKIGKWIEEKWKEGRRKEGRKEEERKEEGRKDATCCLISGASSSKQRHSNKAASTKREVESSAKYLAPTIQGLG